MSQSLRSRLFVFVNAAVVVNISDLRLEHQSDLRLELDAARWPRRLSLVGRHAAAHSAAVHSLLCTPMSAMPACTQCRRTLPPMYEPSVVHSL